MQSDGIVSHPLISGSARPAFDAVDAAGAALLAVTLLWVGVAAGGGEGDPRHAVWILSSSGLTLVAARSLTRAHAWLVPALVYAAVTVLALDAGPGLALQDPLGYANASAALYFLATGAALMVFARFPRPLVRIVSLWAAVATGVLPLLSDVKASAFLVCAYPLAFLVASRPRGMRVLLRVGVALVLSTLAATLVLGITYGERSRPSVISAVIDATLTERREQMWHDALRITRSEPVLGIGTGRFPQVSPTALAHQDQPQAHSEYLQMAAEAGLPGLVLCVALVLWAFARLRVGSPDAGTAVAAVALTGIGIHAGIDYILQFPEVPIAAAALVGAGSRWAHPPRGSSSSASLRLTPAAITYTVGLALLLALPLRTLNTPHMAPNGAAQSPEGVRFTSPGLVTTPKQASDLFAAIVRSGRFSVELRAEPAADQAAGGGWLVSNSRGPSVRNFSIGQSGNDLLVQLRTTETNVNGTKDALRVPTVFRPGRWQRVAIAYDSARWRVYVDGRLRLDAAGPGGVLVNCWDSSYPLVLGNEVGGGRGWLGTLSQVTVYDRALSAEELRRHGTVGPAAAQSEPLVRYVLEGHPVEPNLHIPSHLLAPQEDFVAASLKSTADLQVEALLVLLFLPFGFTVRALLGAGTRATLLVIAMGVALALGVEFFQHLQGYTTSLVDIASAVSGTGLGAVGSQLAGELPPRGASMNILPVFAALKSSASAVTQPLTARTSIRCLLPTMAASSRTAVRPVRKIDDSPGAGSRAQRHDTSDAGHGE
ncbi:MAG: LamG-like jellyroll fold domain-containing protein [Egibacteraceae bacterium]